MPAERRILRALTLAAAVTWPGLAASQQDVARRDVFIVVWRGCEEACEAFRGHFDEHDLPVDVTVHDVARQKSALPAALQAAKAAAPDLVVTWGTSVSTALIGTRDEMGARSRLGDIPALFMIVADPVGADLVESYEVSGRPHVTGVRNRVPEDVQLRIISAYHDPHRVGVINDPAEANSALNTDTLRRIAAEAGFEVIERRYGGPDPAEIPALMADLAEAGADMVYVGSSSFNLEHRAAFTEAALRNGLPVFTAYDAMVRDGLALMSVGNGYANVGRLAARQAERILFEGAAPGDMPIAGLARFSILINMEAARRLDLYPPLPLFHIAERVRP